MEKTPSSLGQKNDYLIPLNKFWVDILVSPLKLTRHLIQISHSLQFSCIHGYSHSLQYLRLQYRIHLGKDDQVSCTRHTLRIFSRPVEQPQINLWFGYGPNPSWSIPTPRILQPQEMKRSHTHEIGQETQHQSFYKAILQSSLQRQHHLPAGCCWFVAGPSWEEQQAHQEEIQVSILPGNYRSFFLSHN